jgi:4-amino-4-deoxy-L-arabinose transferase-like glycosyltransferase
LDYDEAIYLDVARNIQRIGLPLRSLGVFGVPAFEHTPLYLYLLSLYASHSDTGILLSRLVTALLGLGCVWFTFAIGVRISGSVGGFLAALLLAITPFFALHAFSLRMEVPMVFAMLAALWLLLVSDDARRLDATLAAGIMLATAALFREIAILFTAWCGVYVLFLRRRDRRPILPALVVLLAPSVFGFAGWAVWAWRLSPTGFTGAMQRWVDSVATGNVLDPRARIGAGLWAQQLVLDLFGLALIAGLAVCLLLTIRKLISARPWSGLAPVKVLLWGYLLSAVGVSFFVRLKEPRLLIGVLPVTALLIGSSVDWVAIITRVRVSRGWLPRVAVAVVGAAFLLAASPLRVPAGSPASLASWLDPLYSARLLSNDQFYNVLRLAGEYLREHTDPNEVITVAHQATVTSYYADRRTLMLYTMPQDAIERTLQRTTVLVWDDENFQVLSRPEVEALRQEVEKRFVIEQVVRDDVRAVTIYR